MSGSDFLDFKCLAYASRRTARAVTNYFNARMASLDLNVAQFGLLAAVAKMPGSTLSAIGEAMLIEESTMARNFVVLERRGLIKSEGGRGRGGKSVNLTREGRALHIRGEKIWMETNKLLAVELGAQPTEVGRAFLNELGQTAERLKENLREREAAGGRPRPPR